MLYFAAKAKAIVIRHTSGHHVIAVIEIVLPGNKSSQQRLRAFVEKVEQLLRSGIHLLVIGLFPPGNRDPKGIHKAIWDEFMDNGFTLPPGKPLTPAVTALLDSPKTLLLAHRGNSRAAPENTRPAFESALKLGVDLVELDYHHSADGVPVVFHDEELDRCTDACTCWGGQKIPLASRAWSELGQLDAGRWYGEAFAGTRLTTLEEALRLICPRAGCMIERKGGDAQTLVSLVQRLEVIDRCVLTAFDWDFLARCRSLSADLILGALGTERLTEEQLVRARQLDARVIGWDDQFVTAEHIALVHAQGLKAWVWTVDRRQRALELMSWGVDGLISNVPGELLTAMAGAAAEHP